MELKIFLLCFFSIWCHFLGAMTPASGRQLPLQVSSTISSSYFFTFRGDGGVLVLLVSGYLIIPLSALFIRISLNIWGEFCFLLRPCLTQCVVSTQHPLLFPSTFCLSNMGAGTRDIFQSNIHVLQR